MHVALVHYTCPPVVGGVETVLREHAIRFARAGHAVTVLVGEGDELGDGVRLHRIPGLLAAHPETVAAREEVLAGPPGPAFERSCRTMEEALRPALESCDAVFVHNLWTMPFHPAAAVVLAALAGEPGTRWHGRCYSWIHDIAYANSDYRLPHPGRPPWSLLVSRLPGVRCVAVSAHRRRQWSVLAGEHPEDRVIPNGIDAARFCSLPPRLAEWWQRNRISAHEPILLHPARVVRRKQIELSIRTVRALREAGRNAMLIVTGAPDPHAPAGAEYASALQREAEGLPVRFLGGEIPLGEAEVGALYRIVDALLFPSRSEGFGIPPLEATLSRLPAFVSDAPALDELPLAAVTRFEPSSAPEAVARLIVERLDGDPLIADRRRVLWEYDWERIFREQIEPLICGQ